MIQNNKNILENNTPLNDNDNGSLNDKTCLEAIPYKQALQQNGWGELKPLEYTLLPVEPFSLLQLPTPLMNYVYDVADSQQAPMDFIAISALCALAAVSIIGGIQPARIIPIIQDMHRGINDDGLMQRFQMLIFPDERQEQLWVDRPPNQKAWESYQGVFRSLYDKLFGSPKYPITIRFSAEA